MARGDLVGVIYAKGFGPWKGRTWEQVEDTGNFGVWNNRSLDGGASWEENSLISNSEDIPAQIPTLCIDKESRFHAAWIKLWTWDIWYRTSSDGGVSWTDGLGNPVDRDLIVSQKHYDLKPALLIFLEGLLITLNRNSNLVGKVRNNENRGKG